MRAALLLLMIGVMTNSLAQAPQYRALDPRGTWPEVMRIPLAERLEDLRGKKIHLILSWDLESGFDTTVNDLADALRKAGAVPSIDHRNVRYSEDDPQLWASLKERSADGFLYIAAASSSTTSYAFKWSAKLEKSGLPGAVMAFDQLASVGETTSLREGARVRSVAFSYPTSAMPVADYAQAIAQALAALTRPLTDAEQQTGTYRPPANPDIAAEGDLAAVQQAFYAQGFTDGLPIIPPTEGNVAAMLKGTHHRADEVVAKVFYPEGLQATVRQVAINAVMAGCLPEHMPVLLATVEAFQKFNLNSMLRSTNSFAFMQVVNGPIATELKMNAGVNAVGPGNQANAAMGRALRLFIINLGGGAPGVNIMAVIGNNAGYGFMFAENEAQSPWESLSVAQGFKPGDSTLTLFSGGWAHAGNYNLGSKFERVAADIARFESKSGATIIISPQRAQDLSRQGMSRSDAIDFLWRHATRPLGELRQERFFSETQAMKAMPDSAAVPVFPEGSLHIVVAGGDASPMMQAWHMYRPQTVSVDKWR
ncbi:MAG: hypothetical protein H6978_06490 [Gammaproteobacteria bacterium]|nr:hypothetical protein [Gammaproteobacteria bacterium]